MKKKVITITAPVSILNAISLLLITIKPQSRVIEQFILKTIKEPVIICLN